MNETDLATENIPVELVCRSCGQRDDCMNRSIADLEILVYRIVRHEVGSGYQETAVAVMLTDLRRSRPNMVIGRAMGIAN
jgi:hypothetical protein